jgi:hypothetical protein
MKICWLMLQFMYDDTQADRQTDRETDMTKPMGSCSLPTRQEACFLSPNVTVGCHFRDCHQLQTHRWRVCCNAYSNDLCWHLLPVGMLAYCTHVAVGRPCISLITGQNKNDAKMVTAQRLSGFEWNLIWLVGTEFLTAMVMKSSVFSDITPCSPLSVNQDLCLPPAFTLVSGLACSSTLKMKATCSSETSVGFQQTTPRYIPDDRILPLQLVCNTPDCVSKTIYSFG